MYKRQGVDRLNISLDTLRPERYREITCTGELENALRGIEAAERAGFENIKLNCVLLGGMNEMCIRDRRKGSLYARGRTFQANALILHRKFIARQRLSLIHI